MRLKNKMTDGTTVTKTAYKSTKMCRCECSRGYKNKYTLKRHQDTVCPYYAEVRAQTITFRKVRQSSTATAPCSPNELDFGNDHGSGCIVELPQLPLKKRRYSEEWKLKSQCETINPKHKLKNRSYSYIHDIWPKSPRVPCCRPSRKKKKRVKCLFVEEDNEMTTTNSMSEVEIPYEPQKHSKRTLMHQATNTPKTKLSSLHLSNSSDEINKSNLLFDRIFHGESRRQSVAEHLLNRPSEHSVVLTQPVSENDSSSVQSSNSERIQSQKNSCDSTGSGANNKGNRCDASTQTCPQYINFRISIFAGDKIILRALPTFN